MKADLTRDTFDPRHHFRQVLAQQGRVQLDAEINEAAAIAAWRDESTTADLAGHCSGPADGAAFGMSAVAGHPGDFLLSAGRYYVDGIQCVLENPVRFTQQPDLPWSGPLGNGTHLVYLHVWQRHQTFLDNPGLLEPALGGVDTTTRVKTVWQVRTLPVSAPGDCSAGYPDFTLLSAASTIRLQAKTDRATAVVDPCQISEASGYAGLENQLYRVEVHSLIAADQARGTGRAALWKWSRENGSIEATLLNVTGTKLLVSSLGRDEKLGFRKGHFVEITDDSRELAGLPGDLIEVDDVDEDDLTITLKAAPAIITSADPDLHPRVRRWEGVETANTAWKTLEAGIQVKLSDINTARPGDYWQIPARASAPGAQTGTVLWPKTGNTAVALRPHGVTHHFCRLGFVTVSAAPPVFTDCRCLWPALTQVPRLFYLSGDGQEVRPGSTPGKLPHPLIAGLANAHCHEGVHQVKFTVTQGTGTLAAPAAPPAAGPLTVNVNGDGEASCEFYPDTTNYSQQVKAELLDRAGQPVRPAIYYNATLSIASEVAYYPPCRGMQGRHTVQEAISHLAGAIHLSAVGGDGQDGSAGKELRLPLRVCVTSACGPLVKQPVVFRSARVDEKSPLGKLTSGLFSGKKNAPDTDKDNEITVFTDSDGIAECWWTLPGHSAWEVFEASAALVDEAKLPLEGPSEVRFTANLRAGGGEEDAPGAIHIRAIELNGTQLKLDAEVGVNAFRNGIELYFDGQPFAPWLENPPVGNSSLPSSRVCTLTVDVPYPLGRSEQADLAHLIESTQVQPTAGKLPASRVVGFRPLVLSTMVLFAGEDGKPAHLFIQPQQEAVRYLEAILLTLPKIAAPQRILIRLLLRGNFIFGMRERSVSSGLLDGDSFAYPDSAELVLPSGDRRSGGDFEMWFWLVPDALQPEK